MLRENSVWGTTDSTFESYGSFLDLSVLEKMGVGERRTLRKHGKKSHDTGQESPLRIEGSSGASCEPRGHIRVSGCLVRYAPAPLLPRILNNLTANYWPAYSALDITENARFLEFVKSNDNLGNENTYTDLLRPTLDEVRRARPIVTVFAPEVVVRATLVASTVNLVRAFGATLFRDFMQFLTRGCYRNNQHIVTDYVYSVWTS
jgi:hypothetical protein